MVRPLDKELEIAQLLGTKVAELSGHELMALLELIITQHGVPDANRRVTSLSIPEFAAMMVDLQQTKQYVQAQKEYETSLKVFKDIETLAASTPFRVTTVAELELFVEDVKKMFDPTAILKSHLIIAVATVPAR